MKKYLKHLSKVPNVSNPNFNDETVLDIIRNAGYSVYIDEYKRSPTSTGNDNQGTFGFWTRQLAGIGVEHPIIYYNEIYSFIKDTKVWSCVISWKYDSSDSITSDTCVTEFKDKSAPKIKNLFKDGITLINGNCVAGVFTSFELTKDAIKKDLEQFDEIK